MDRNASRFTIYARTVLVYVVVVIMWGAYVRATGSGAGCGAHWPMCNGEIIPRDPSMKMLIEFSHRLSSGLSLLLVVGLVYASRKVFPAGHAARRGAAWSLGFILGEAAVGAMLVILGLVHLNESVMRAVVIALHLLNTFFLLYWLTYTAHSAGGLPLAKWSWRGVRVNLFLAMTFFAIIGVAGAIVALGDTLFPATSLSQGMAQDFSPTAHFLIRLRLLHPVLAVFGTGYILLQMIMLPRFAPGALSPRRTKWVMGLISLQVVGGLINLQLLAPVWMQLVHLMLADAVWIALVGVYIDARRRVGSEKNATIPTSDQLVAT